MVDHIAHPEADVQRDGWMVTLLKLLVATIGYAAVCVGLYVVVHAALGRTNWWAAPLVLTWGAAAFGIGYLWKRYVWVAGPLLTALALIAYYIMLEYFSPDTGDGWGSFIAMIIAVMLVPTLLLMALFGAAGVRLGLAARNRTATATEPAAMRDASAPAPLEVPTGSSPEPMPVTRPREFAPATPAGEAPAATMASDDRQLVEDILSTPMPGDLRRPTTG